MAVAADAGNADVRSGGSGLPQNAQPVGKLEYWLWWPPSKPLRWNASNAGEKWTFSEKRSAHARALDAKRRKSALEIEEIRKEAVDQRVEHVRKGVRVASDENSRPPGPGGPEPPPAVNRTHPRSASRDRLSDGAESAPEPDCPRLPFCREPLRFA
ncbi:hypothetical protein HPB47_023332 [Ixodes persulcatus]|uniref:Uncharacterized protein n=1 Tax=Ixodes persulcatus TaxID=34615 RepID=A0AC60Q7P2_IXOPE|nr:hypothetical protein HPB47_023332 [Ixodes persulcatus]